MTLKGGTSQACAACKYQRRRCLPECQLAPYFPADQPKMFQNAHRLFGVSNILKILKQLDPSQRGEAMRSIIYQSDIREKYPVAGCFGYIHQLHYQIQLCEEELHAIRSQIALCKMQQQHGQNEDNQIMQTNVVGDDEDSTSLLQLGMGPPNNNHNINANNHNNHNNNNNNNAAEMMFENGGLMGNGYEQFWGQQGYGNNNLMDFQLGDVVQQQFATAVPSSQQVVVAMPPEMGGINNSLLHHFEGMHPFLDAIDDRQSTFIDSKVAYESSSSDSEESSDPMKAMEHQVVESTDLKNAAACFSLTSVN